MIKLKNLLPESPFAVFVLAKTDDGYAATTRAADRNEQGKIGLPNHMDENLSNHMNESIVKRVDIENLLPDKNNMEVAVDSLRKGMQSPSNSPIEVYASEDKYIVADGHHRLLQAIINGESSVNVKVLDSEKPMSRNGTVALDFLDGDYYGLDNNLESGWLIKRL